jgi:hypothetical protein
MLLLWATKKFEYIEETHKTIRLHSVVYVLHVMLNASFVYLQERSKLLTAACLK